MAFVAAFMLFVAMSTGAQPKTAPLVGRAEDFAGLPLPGVTVVVTGPRTESTVVTDHRGRFEIADAPPATYFVTATLPGFRTQRVTVQHGSTATVVIRLPVAPLAEVLWVVPEAAQAYQQATAIVHLQIVETAPPGSCESTPMITSRHTAAALRVFKGNVPDVIRLEQEGAGRCRDGIDWQEGLETPYRIGEQYVAFLTGAGGVFGRVSGPSLSFRVTGNRVTLNGFAGINESITLDELQVLLERLGQ